MPPAARATAADTGFVERVLVDAGTRLRYQVYLPAGFDGARAWPVVLFLHGSGERGDDNVRQTGEGLGNAIRRSPDRFPAIVVFPQAPGNERWNGKTADRALAMLERTIAEFHGDPERVTAVGISMGGYGVLRIAAAHPERFAAVVSVCGGILPPEYLVREGVVEAPAPGGDPYGEAAERL